MKAGWFFSTILDPYFCSEVTKCGKFGTCSSTSMPATGPVGPVSSPKYHGKTLSSTCQCHGRHGWQSTVVAGQCSWDGSLVTGTVLLGGVPIFPASTFDCHGVEKKPSIYTVCDFSLQDFRTTISISNPAVWITQSQCLHVDDLLLPSLTEP